MGPRFDVFKTQQGNTIKWMGTAGTLEEAEELVVALTEDENDSFVVLHWASGVTRQVASFRGEWASCQALQDASALASSQIPANAPELQEVS